ncbi:MAG: PIN domain-containing protein [Spirochaetota bacterium]|jgi:predicted nucleic acid-binding protein|nr:PIN domain-containing protein [Spirochaetota bacterium]
MASNNGKRLFLDTNIIIDVIAKRKGYADSLQIMRYCETNHADGFISAISVTDVMYILRKYITPNAVRGAVQTLLAIVHLTDVRKGDILTAFSGNMKDFEDAVQASCARRIQADYIVTHNIRDFTESAIPAILPSDVVKLLRG